ncbi:MAG TPA: hypothetical protein VN515_01685 [Terriglobales bacterium]|nr:hypothetical protein [Terriglobales bacterium]
MEERDFFNESTETKKARLTCTYCRTEAEYAVSWVVRRKKPALPPRADSVDRARFAKASSYMVRRDDKIMCSNPRCRKTFEIAGLQSVVSL